MAQRHFQLGDLIEVVADAVGDRTAIVCGDRRLTYAQLDERATRLSNYLRGIGVQPRDKVAIYSWNRTEWMEAAVGIAKARAAAVNINYRYVAEELRYVLADSDTSVIVAERQFLPMIDELRAELPLVHHVLVIDDGTDHPVTGQGVVAFEEALASASAERPDLERSDDDLYLLYTGGTTGMPKGVMWRHEDVFFGAMSSGLPRRPQRPEELAELVLPQAPVALTLAPVMHGAAQWGAWGSFFMGVTVVFVPEGRFNAELALDAAAREHCNSIMLVGDAMARPLAEALAAHPGRWDLSALRRIGSGGAVFSDAVQDQLRALLPGLTISDTIGSSETGHTGSAPGKAGRFIGRPNVAVLGDDLRPLAPGSEEVGRLALKGHIPLGYYKDEAKTKATFVVDPDGTRWSVPGDHARVEADGEIVLLGRGSQCINTGGEKVYPEEVESALKHHPDVFDVLVVGVPDERFGESVAAVVAPRDGAKPTLEDLVVEARRHVAGYKVPRRLVVVPEIARTPAGKPDYRWAKRMAADTIS